MQRRRKSTTSVSARNTAIKSRASRLEAIRRASVATYERLENRQLLSASVNPIPLTGPAEGWSAAYFGDKGGGAASTSFDPLTDWLAAGQVTPLYSKIVSTVNNSGAAPAGPSGVPGYNGGLNFSVRYDGYLLAPASGTMTFWAASDDGVQVSIDETTAAAEAAGTAAPKWVIVDQRMKDARGMPATGYNESVPVGTVSAPANSDGTHNDTTSSGPAFNFVAGQLYHVEAAFQNGGGGWGVRLGWSGPATGQASNPIIPQSNVYAAAPPANVQSVVAQQGTGVNQVTWTENVNGAGVGDLTGSGAASSFRIERTPDGSTWNTIGTVTADYSGTNANSGNARTYSYVDTTAADGTAYEYRVTPLTSYATGNTSGASQIAISADGQLTAPTHVTALRTAPTSVTVAWDSNFNAVGGYDVKRATSIDASGNLVGATDLGVTANASFVDTTGAAGTNYFYTVTSLHGVTQPGNTVTDSVPSAAVFVGHGDGWDASYYGFSVATNTNNDINNPHTADDSTALLGFQRIESGPIKLGAPTLANGTGTGPTNYPAQWTATGAHRVLSNPSQPGLLFDGRWVGYVEAPVTGYYTFALGSDDGNNVVYYDQAHLDANGNPIGVPLNNNQILANRGVPNPFDQAPVVDTTGTPVLFTAGQKYLIQYEFNNGGGGWGANLMWSASAGTTPSAGDLMIQQYVPAGDVIAPLPVFKTIYANDVALDANGIAVRDATGRSNTLTGTNITMGSVTKDASFYALSTTVGDSQVQLNWNNIGAASYNIYMYDNGTDASPNPATTGYTGAHPVTQLFTGITATQGAGLVKTIMSLTNNHHYTFYVSGVDQAGETPFASTTSATVTPQPTAPVATANVQVNQDYTANNPLNLAANTDNLVVTWNATPFAATYSVTRIVDGVADAAPFATGVTGTSVQDPNRPLGHVYTYSVTGTNTGGTGPAGVSNAWDLTHGTTEAYYSDPWWYSNGFTNPGYTNVGANGNFPAGYHLPDSVSYQPQVNFNSGDPNQPNVGASVADRLPGSRLGTNYSTVYEGTIVIPAAGNYTFGLNSDDASALMINGQIVVSAPGCCADNFAAAAVHFNAGDHVSFIYWENEGGGGHSQNLIWKYTLDDTTVVPRQDIPQANLLINDGAPALATGVTTAADATPGVVDVSFTDNSINELHYQLLRSTSLAGPYTATGTVGYVSGTGATILKDTSGTLSGVTYYYEVAASNLYGTTVTAPSAATAITETYSSVVEHFYSNQYWGSTTNANNYQTPSLSPFYVSGQQQINANVGNPPGSGTFNGNQQFSDIFTGKITAPATGTYLFYANGDDDSYMYVNGQLVSAAPGGHGPFYPTAIPIVLTAGQSYDIEYLHSQGGGGWQVQAGWVLPNADGTAGTAPVNAANGNPAVVNGFVVIPSSAFSPVSSNVVAPIALAPAQTFTNITGASVTLNFTDNSISELEFSVQRSTSSDFSTGVTTFAGSLSNNPGGASATAHITDTGLTPNTVYYYRVASVNYNGSSTYTPLGSITTALYNTPTYFSANPGNSLETVLQWVNPTTTASPFMAIESSPDGLNWTQIATKPVTAGASDSYHITGGTAGTITYYRIRGVDVASPATPTAFSGYSIAEAVNPVAMVGTPAVINYSTGFTGAVPGALVSNSSAANLSPTVLPNGNLQLTDNIGNETRTVWTANPVSIANFTTTFDYTATAGTGIADGFTFTLQNDPRGTAAIGDGGGAKGVAGGAAVVNSISIGLNPYNNVNQAVVYLNGVIQDGTNATPNLIQDMTPSGIDLHSGHTFQITINYDGTTVTASVTDVTSLTHPTFSLTPQTINLATQLGGTTAYAGFTGATGGATSQQVFSNWSYAIPVTNAAPTVAAFTVPNSVEGTAFASTPVNFTGQNGDTFSATVDYGDGSTPTVITGLTVTGGNGTFNIGHAYAEEGVNTVSITVTDTTTSVTSTPATTASATVTGAALGATITGAPAGAIAPGTAVNLNFNVTQPNTLEADAGTPSWTITGPAGFTTLTGTTATTSFTPTIAGTYHVTMTASEAGATDTETGTATPVDITVNAAAPTVVSRVLDDGNIQKSMIRYITYTFSSPVSLAAGAVTLFQSVGVTYPGNVFTAAATNVDASAALGAPIAVGTAGANGTNTAWKIPIVASSFSTTLLNAGGATLNDGVYQTTVHASLVTDASNQHLAADKVDLHFHRLYGDINGNKIVNSVDYGQFTPAFGHNFGDPKYNVYFDYTNDHRINSLDYGQFLQRFGKSLSYTP